MVCSGIKETKKTKKILDSLDLPCIGKVQNERITAKLTTDEIHAAQRYYVLVLIV